MTIDYNDTNIYEALYGCLPCGVAVYDEHGNAVYVNKVFLTTTGFNNSDFMKMSITDLTGLDKMEFRYNQTIKVIHERGGDFPCRGTYTAIDPKHYILFVEKITDISHLNIENLSDIDKYKLFLDLTDSIILLIDANGRVRYINQTGCEILGYEREYIIGKEWVKHFIPKELQDNVEKIRSGVLESGDNGEVRIETPVLTTLGERKLIKWRNISIVDENSNIAFTLSSGTDITEQNRIDLRFRRADEIAQMGNWSRNLATGEYSCSDGFFRILGLEPGEFEPTNDEFIKFFHPDDKNNANKIMADSNRTKSGYNLIFRIIRADGKVRYVKAANSFLENIDGEYSMSYGTVIDVTEMMKSRLKLQETKNTLQIAEEIANIGSYVRDIKTNKYICSSGFFKIVGMDYTDEPLDYSEISSFTHPDDSEYVARQIELSLGSESGFDFENRIVRKDGIVKFIRSKGTLIRDEKGKTIKVIGTLLDITQYKENEERLEKSSLKLEQAEDVALLGYWEKNLTTGIYNCSKGFCRICGLDPETFLPDEENMALTIHPADREKTENDIKSSRKAGTDLNVVHRVLRPDGDIRYVQSNSTFIKDDKGNPVKNIGITIDVTEYIENENRLKEMTKTLEAAESLAKIGHWEWDIETDEYKASDGYYNITELPRDKILGAKLMALAVHPDDLDLVLGRLNESLETGRDFTFEHRLLTAAGNLKYIRSMGTYIKDKSGKPVKRIGTIIDVTDYVLAVEKLKENEKRLVEAELLAQTGHWEWNLKTGEHFMSRGLLNILGYESMDKLPPGGNLKAIYYKTDVKRVRNIIDDAIENKRDSYYHEAIIQRPDGELRNVSVNGILVKDETGEVIKTRGTYTDITRIKEYQHRIRENEIRMRSAEEAAGIGSWERDLRTGIYICSPGVYKIWGQKEGTGFSTFEEQVSVIHPDDRESTKRIVEESVKRGENYELNHKILRKDGEIRYLHIKAIILKDSEGTPVKVYGTVIDVTDEKKIQAERKLLESRLRNQQKLESLGILAGGVAHEINNPLNGIMNYNQLILDSVDKDSEIAQYAEETINETERISEIVKNLLRFSRMDQLTHSKKGMDDIMTRTLSLINTIFKKDDIAVNVNIPSDLPMIDCNSQQIQQVLMNILTNARDSLNDKYPGYDKRKIIAVSGQIIEKSGKSFIQLVIEDKGSGIPEGIQENIFDPFFTTKQPGKGTGLGLSISYGIIEEHGGELYFTTEENEYTRFYIELPVENPFNGQ